jgi:hypothetical protein
MITSMQRMRGRLQVLAWTACSLAGLGGIGMAFAQDRPAAAIAPAEAAQRVEWSSLTPAQQQALAPLREQWTGLAPRQQQRFLRIGARWQDAAAAQRAAIEGRIARWAAMTPTERAALRQRYQQFRGLPAEQQQDLRDAFQHFRDLPPEQRQALRQRFEQMTPDERAAAMANTGADKPPRGWQRLFDEVPAEQRASTRAMWLAFGRDERRALRRHVQTLSDADRASLRTQLLAMTPAQRSDFIARLPPAPAAPTP